VVKESSDAPKGELGPFLYLWLALSLLINVSGIASIADGFVHWANFFQDFLQIYHEMIRDPLSWAAHRVWPPGWPRIPPWIFDLLVVWSGVFLATNIENIRNTGQTVFGDVFSSLGLIMGIPVIAFIFFFCPVLLPLRYVFPRNESRVRDRRAALEALLYFFLLFATVVILAFLNWQLQHLAH
jgi:hypothetical protein